MPKKLPPARPTPPGYNPRTGKPVIPPPGPLDLGKRIAKNARQKTIGNIKQMIDWMGK